MKSRFEPTRKALIFWCLFIGLGAAAGSAGMLLDPTGRSMGMDAMLPYFQKLPFAEVLFQNFLFSGIALLIVNGITNLTAAVLLLRRKTAGILLGMAFGVTLMLWICIQFYLFPLNFMSTAYFVFGLIQALTGYAAWVFFRQEQFRFSAGAYPQVGTNHKRLVVYFSRMGYTRTLAYEVANQTGAEILALSVAEPTAGTGGFWWCGRYGMHRWPMPIKPISVDLAAYEHVTICSPIWVFHICAPVREFCQQASGKIREADYLVCHHMKCGFRSAAQEMDQLLGIHHTAFASVCCKKGAYSQCLDVPPGRHAAHPPA